MHVLVDVYQQTCNCALLRHHVCVCLCVTSWLMVLLRASGLPHLFVITLKSQLCVNNIHETATPNTHTHTHTKGLSLVLHLFETLQWTPTTEEPVQPDRAPGDQSHAGTTSTFLYFQNTAVFKLQTDRGVLKKRNKMWRKDIPASKCFSDFFLCCFLLAMCTGCCYFQLSVACMLSAWNLHGARCFWKTSCDTQASQSVW